VNIRETRVARMGNIHERIFKRRGWVKVADGRVGMAKRRCSCSTGSCGFRAFPGVERVRDLQWSDSYKLLRRAGKTDSQIDIFAKDIEERRRLNERLRASGGLRKIDMMFLGRVPADLVDGLCHDFPADFASVDGVSVDIQHKNLERVFSDLFVNRCYRAGVSA
jgi:hypothetical protein